MQYIIQNKSLRVTIESLGAEMISVIKGGKERLWQNENGSWAGHAPVLFPVCGHFAVAVNGTKYAMRAHGFAKKTEFTLLAKGEDFIELGIKDSEETRKVYPYSFAFAVRYALRGDAVTVTYRVTNTGGETLAFSCGGHPSFALQSGVEDYAVEFEQAEHLVHLPHNEGGYLTGERVDFGTLKKFPLPSEYLQEGNTLIFGDIASRKVTLSRRSGEQIAEISFKDFPHLLLWRPHGANMICIEPWLNLPDLERDDYTELTQKRGVERLSAGGEKTLSFEIKYC